MMSAQMERIVDEAAIQHIELKNPQMAKEVRAKLNVSGFH
jgi:hypothetical protein